MDINIESGGVQGVVGSFQGQVSQLQSQFEEIMNKTSEIKSSWEGDDADAILAQIEQFQTAFEAINAKNSSYIAFMNSSAQAYTEEDSQISSAADSLGD